MNGQKNMSSKAEIELTDKELDGVAGGTGRNIMDREAKAKCPKCNAIRSFRLVSGARAVCNECNTVIIL